MKIERKKVEFHEMFMKQLNWGNNWETLDRLKGIFRKPGVGGNHVDCIRENSFELFNNIKCVKT